MRWGEYRIDVSGALDVRPPNLAIRLEDWLIFPSFSSFSCFARFCECRPTRAELTRRAHSPRISQDFRRCSRRRPTMTNEEVYPYLGNLHFINNDLKFVQEFSKASSPVHWRRETH